MFKRVMLVSLSFISFIPFIHLPPTEDQCKLDRIHVPINQSVLTILPGSQSMYIPILVKPEDCSGPITDGQHDQIHTRCILETHFHRASSTQREGRSRSIPTNTRQRTGSRTRTIQHRTLQSHGGKRRLRSPTKHS